MDLRNLLASGNYNPGKVLKTVISLSAVLLIVWLFLVSRMELDNNIHSDPASVERTDSLRASLSDGQPSPLTSDEESPNIFMNAVTTFIVLGTILIIVLLFLKKGKGQFSAPRLQEIEGYMLGQGAQIKVIEMNQEVWVIGLTSSQINLLHRYPKDEWKGGIDVPKGSDDTFYTMFKKKISK